MVIHEEPFDSINKKHLIAIRMDNKVRVFVKGAPEIILYNCDTFLSADGKLVSLDEEASTDAPLM